MTKNYIFREFECGLAREQTAELCFKSVRTLTEWEGFRVSNGKLQVPNGKFISPQGIITGIAFFEIGADLENKIKSEVLKYARLISKLKR
ncbi:regulator [Vibrio pectenicida]|uniref:regulator n=1 Tax=Vibrio pectenicida TaxID=62763 RepID=UPI001C0F46A2|nr:regulator [Vibrio pectenicida]